MRFASLGSGSKGNATLVEVGDTCLLIDCGFSCLEAEKRLAGLALQPGDVAAILVTHEHSDHISGVARLSRRYGIPVWMTAGTEAAHKGGKLAEWHCFNAHQRFAIGDVLIQPFPVPHDAREPCQFVFSDGVRRLGLLTDTGTVTPHIVRALDQLDALILECNHDPELLASGSYPWHLKKRVGGPLGHLSNQQAADLLTQIDVSRLQHLIAAHLSENNNSPHLVRQLLSLVPDCRHAEILVADQPAGMPWKTLE
ncbi:MAG: MBL fold metallo-hydrolase [Thiogranum sp.]